jgi:hypothetical protein
MIFYFFTLYFYLSNIYDDDYQSLLENELTTNVVFIGMQHVIKLAKASSSNIAVDPTFFFNMDIDESDSLFKMIEGETPAQKRMLRARNLFPGKFL